MGCRSAYRTKSGALLSFRVDPPSLLTRDPGRQTRVFVPPAAPLSCRSKKVSYALELGLGTSMRLPHRPTGGPTARGIEETTSESGDTTRAPLSIGDRAQWGSLWVLLGRPPYSIRSFSSRDPYFSPRRGTDLPQPPSGTQRDGEATVVGTEVDFPVEGGVGVVDVTSRPVSLGFSF